MIKKEPTYISIEKASEHNLKFIDLKIPHYQITCFTGVSGSGKSSLVYDIICKESQRRYFESFSSYARQFLGKIGRPEVEHIEGLMPAISVDQKTISRNPRSTVGIMSELYDFLRLLFARLGEKTNQNSDIKISRSLFSFNSPEGYCPKCKGLGVEDQIDPELLIKDPNKSLRQGALKITTPTGYTIYSQVTIDVMDQVCRSEGFNVDIPWKNLTPEQKNIILYGSNKIKIPYGKHTLESRMKWSGITAKPREEGFYKGILPVMENILRVDRNPNILRFARTVNCSRCSGMRLNHNALSVKFDHKSIIDYAEMSISQLKQEFKNIEVSKGHEVVFNPIRDKIIERCEKLEELGLGYLSLMRESTSLSGGEAQRIRLATQIGNGLRGILYVLDEPSIGLHPHDNQRMINVMKQLRDQGNTILVVEHDRETIENADQIIDIGPLAGKNGGEILFNEKNQNLQKIAVPQSETLKYLTKTETIPLPEKHHKDQWIRIKGACMHNLKNINVDFRLQALNVVTGVSGAGKSTLVFDILGNYYEKKLAGESTKTLGFQEISSDIPVRKIITIDQTPIGRTPRSNAATYTKVFDHIRKLYGNLPESKKKKLTQSHFSFNTAGGRCEACEGAGSIQTGMHFLGQVETVCEVCGGKRYHEDILSIRYNGKDISEVLEMEISDAVDFFRDDEKIHHYLEIMKNLGLGYLSLGQSATTLSGGEAQRLKLATELVKPVNEHTLYLFDEPTTGLHPYDISILLKAISGLTEKGHTVIIIEHDQTILKQADQIIDLGPLGGDSGGELIFSGTLSELLKNNNSLTAHSIVNPNKQTKRENRNLKEIIEAPIKLRGVTTHNLKNIDIEIPRNKLTVITGVSGSGKSSLAFDTLFAEGQYRFTESFSTYARSLIQQKPKPDILETSGLMPTIAIDNKSVAKTSRATVGTVTGIYDLYRLLYSRISKNKQDDKCNLLSSHFSFNHQSGACPVCNGLGIELTCDPDKLITNPELALNQGAMKGSKPGQFYGDPYGQYMWILHAVGESLKINFEKPWNELDDFAKEIALFGTGEKEYGVQWKYKRKNREGTHQFKSRWIGLVHYINDEYHRKHDKQGGEQILALMKEVDCKACQGTRLNTQALEYIIAGKNIAELSSIESTEALSFFYNLKKNLTENENKISAEIQRLVIEKLDAICKIGLGYLSMHRNTKTLSGGESRRIRLVSQLGGTLTGICYVLDEPTVGLHSKDTKKLIGLIQELAKDNTVVVVEHDEEVIQSADYIIELGPGAGDKGGEVVAAGNKNVFLQNIDSVTSKYLNTSYSPKLKRESIDLKLEIHIQDAQANNLKNINLELPANGITIFSGVSGSGKSSLLFDVIGASALAKHPVNCSNIKGLESFGSIISMDQSPIGNNPLSTPITFLGIYDDIRDLFASTTEASAKNLKKSDFSYNTKGGRCETCKGQGQTKVSLDFLSDVWVNCPECNGKRFTSEILQVKWNNLSIYDVLELTANEASKAFDENKNLLDAFLLLTDLGLGHIKLGQSAPTLSGGESQRLKLARELLKKQKNRCLYLLDEPTTGLHFYDIEKLLNVLFKLREQGHALYIIEHHPWFYDLADFLVKLGPEGGEKGGYLI
ncbi:MAG TPA: excinuclease ABC subunit UvrA [Bacteroidales bacterium]|nr:excinuclease ABC subunit UvrA [Bacteroidales bacterium]